MTTDAKVLRLMLAAAAIVLVLAGCESDADRAARGEGFAPEGTIRSPERVRDAQKAAGARAEGNLYEAHFVGAELNSLGRSKLDAMLVDDDALPLVVHLSPAGEHAIQSARMEAVATYLRDGGLTESQIRFTDGLNESAYAPAAPGLADLRKTDTAAAGADLGTGDYPLGGAGPGPVMGAGPDRADNTDR